MEDLRGMVSLLHHIVNQVLIFIYNNSKSEFGDNFEFFLRGILTHEFTTLATSCQALALSRTVLPEPVNCPNILNNEDLVPNVSIAFPWPLTGNTPTFRRHIFFFIAVFHNTQETMFPFHIPCRFSVEFPKSLRYHLIFNNNVQERHYHRFC